MSSGRPRRGPNAAIGVLGGVVAIVAGRFFGLDVALAAGALTLCLVCVCWFSVRRAPILDATRRVSPPQPHADGALTVDLQVRADRSTGPAVMHDPISDRHAATIYTRSIPSEPTHLTYGVGQLRRGPLVLGPLTIELGDPFGFFVRQYRTPALTILVHPRIVDVTATDAGVFAVATSGQSLAGQRATVTDVDPDGVREWVPGDDVRHVHWTATARRGHPIVRTFGTPTTVPIIVVLDLRTDDEDAFELAVIGAASIIDRATLAALAPELHLIRADDVEVVPTRHGRDAMLDRLATVAADGTHTDVSESIADTTDHDPTSWTFVTTARNALAEITVHPPNRRPTDETRPTHWNGHGPLQLPNRTLPW